MPNTLARLLAFAVISTIVTLMCSSCTPVARVALSAAQDLVSAVQADVVVDAPGTFVVSPRVVYLDGRGSARVTLRAPTSLSGEPSVVFDHAYEAGAQVGIEVVLFSEDGGDWLRLERVSCARIFELLHRAPDCASDARAAAPVSDPAMDEFKPVRIYSRERSE